MKAQLIVKIIADDDIFFLVLTCFKPVYGFGY